MAKQKRSAGTESTRAPRFHRDMLVAEAVDKDSRVKEILLGHGLPCYRCIVAESETLAQGCAPLGLSVERIVRELNALD